MSKTRGSTGVRLTGVLYGLVSTLGGVVVVVLFARIPSGLLHALPPWLGRTVLNVAPWLVASGTGGSSGIELLAIWLAAVAFLSYGLWALREALFGSADSLSLGGGTGDRGDGD